MAQCKNHKNEAEEWPWQRGAAVLAGQYPTLRCLPALSAFASLTLPSCLQQWAATRADPHVSATDTDRVGRLVME